TRTKRGLAVAHHYRLAGQVLGDMIAVCDGAGGDAFCVADVCGTGAHSLLAALSIKAWVSALHGRLGSAAAMVGGLKRRLCSYVSHEMFVNMSYMVLNTETWEIRTVVAGPHRPWLRSWETGHVEKLPATGPVLGVAEEFAFEESASHLEEGD